MGGATQQQTGHRREKDQTSRLATIGALACSAIASIAIVGWLAGVPSFTTLGVGNLAVQPLTALVFALIAAAHFATVRGGRRYRTPLIVVTWALLLLSQAYLFGERFAIEPVLGDLLTTAAMAHMPIEPIRSPTLIVLLLLLAALMPATATGRWPARGALMLATIGLILGGVVMIDYLNRVNVVTSSNHLLIMSFPSAAMTLILAGSIITWRYCDGWPAIFWTAPEESAEWSLLPLILILILIQFMFQTLVYDGVIDDPTADSLTLVANIGIIIAIVVFGARRLVERRRERDDLAGAIELAAVMVVDREGVILHWSRGCQDLYGWPAELAVGRRRRELLGSNEYLPLSDIWQKLDAEGTLDRELIEYHRDGHQLIIDNHAKILSRSTDRSSAVVAVTDVTKRRVAEAALRSSEARLRAAVEVQGLTIIEWDIANERIDWTVNLEAMCGPNPPRTSPEFATWGRKAIGEEDWDTLAADIRTALDGQETRVRRVVGVRREPDVLCLFELSALILHENGKAVRMILTGNDVTEHYRREEAIMVGEARLATAVAAQGIFIYEYDLLTEQPIWTTDGESFLGVTDKAGFFGMPDSHWNRIPEIARQVRAAVAEAIMQEQERIHFSFEFERLDGVHRWADSWARIIRDADGRPLRVIGTHLDITERHRRESALRASEAEMRAILATVPDAMIVCTEAGVVRAFSAAAEALFGYDAEDLIGRNILDLAANDGPGRAAMRRSLFQVVHRDKEPSWPMPVMARRSDGATVPVSFVLGETMVEGQRMFVVFGRDMRAHIASEEKLLKLQQDLAQAARLGTMGEMAAALAHELSQPLAAIVNFLGAAELTIQLDGDSDRLNRAIHSAAEQASRAGEIIRRLRAFISRGEADMRVEPVARLVREAASLAMLNMSSLGVRLTYDFEDEDRRILADRIQIQQVLVNLIRNGVEAMTGSGCSRREMIITTKSRRDGFLEVEVSDTGPGIAPEILDTLFSPFATTKNEGLGFGLSICRRIIEAHGGQLSANTGPAGGAVFRFTLPVMDEETRRS